MEQIPELLFLQFRGFQLIAIDAGCVWSLIEPTES